MKLIVLLCRQGTTWSFLLEDRRLGLVRRRCPFRLALCTPRFCSRVRQSGLRQSGPLLLHKLLWELFSRLAKLQPSSVQSLSRSCFGSWNRSCIHLWYFYLLEYLKQYSVMGIWASVAYFWSLQEPDQWSHRTGWRLLELRLNQISSLLPDHGWSKRHYLSQRLLEVPRCNVR